MNDRDPEATIDTDEIASPDDATSDKHIPAPSVMAERPRSEWLVWAAFVAAFAPVIVEYAREWAADERYSHGWLIFPISLGLTYMNRARLAASIGQGSFVGLPLIVFGLAVNSMAWFLRFPHVGMWSLVMVLAGIVMSLYGMAAWRVVRFPTLFLLFAGTWPNRLIEPINLKVQAWSAVGAAHIMDFLGYTVMREGNRIEIPGHVVEVADICSGYKKTVALLAFAFLYGYVMTTSPFKRIVLCVAAIPIAVLANVGRVAGLIAVTSAGGSEALHKAHDPAEMVALLVAFVLFIFLGKAIGCRLPEPA